MTTLYWIDGNATCLAVCWNCSGTGGINGQGCGDGCGYGYGTFEEDEDEDEDEDY